jgi:hypothetical protein
MKHGLPLGIDRVSRVLYSAPEGSIKVRLAIMPPGASLPPSLLNPATYTVTLDDAEETTLRVDSVVAIASEPSIVLGIVAPPDVSSGRFTICVDGLVPGLDAVDVVWGVDQAAFDPGTSAAPAAVDPSAPTLANYLYRDFRSFKQLMIDTVRRDLPHARETHAADAGIAIVDVLAYAADNLAYFQDAVATEAYLDTARRRVSVRRHARLLGYRLYEGCTPRVWMHVCPEREVTIPRGHAFHTATDSQVDPLGFEALCARTVDPAQCGMTIWDFGGAEVELPAGRTTAVVDGPRSAALHAGDVLVFEQQFDPGTGAAAPPGHRQAVRLRTDGLRYDDHPSGDPTRCLTQITWHAEDALRASYALRPNARGESPARVLGNMIPADFGLTFDDPEWYEIDARGIVRAYIPDLTFAVPYAASGVAVAAGVKTIRAYNALPQITAVSYPFGRRREWKAREDLIGADPFERAFVVEIERNGSVLLRFGDGRSGARPLGSSRFALSYRRGYGLAGHVGPDAIRFAEPLSDGTPVVARNPLASYGGAERQDQDEARREAPELVRNRRPERCVTDDDFVRRARDVEGVRAAAARRRWTGSGTTVQVFVDGDGSGSDLRARVGEALQAARIIGTDVTVRDPRRIGVLVALEVRCRPGASPSDVLRRVTAAATAAIAAERLTLGSTLYASWFIAAAMRTPDVADAALTTFRRVGGPDMRAKGAIAFGPTEVPQIVDADGLSTGGRPLVALRA